MARMLARVLREEGYVAESAGDGRTGLGRALDDSFDLSYRSICLRTSAKTISRKLTAGGTVYGRPISPHTALGRDPDSASLDDLADHRRYGSVFLQVSDELLRTVLRDRDE